LSQSVHVSIGVVFAAETDEEQWFIPIFPLKAMELLCKLYMVSVQNVIKYALSDQSAQFKV
jgi:hypothetical protein